MQLSPYYLINRFATVLAYAVVTAMETIAKKKVEDVMPIATGHEKEELDAELEVIPCVFFLLTICSSFRLLVTLVLENPACTCGDVGHFATGQTAADTSEVEVVVAVETLAIPVAELDTWLEFAQARDSLVVVVLVMSVEALVIWHVTVIVEEE
ncbi:hypothetical protein Bca4012_048384 [Brassica carinata]